MSAHPPDRRSQDRVLAGLEQALIGAARPNPLVLVWRWRYELLLLVAVPLGIAALARTLGAWEAAVIVALAVVVGVAWPAARRALIVRFWCIVTPHRVRAACAQARLHNRRGRLPAVLRTSATPEGERVVLWCPAGTTPQDVASLREVLATACLATEVVVSPHPRQAHLVTLAVVRRAPARRSGILGEGPGPLDPDTLVLPPGLPRAGA